MTSPPASVDGDSAGIGVGELGASRFGIVNADPSADIRLEFLVSRCESQDEVPHKGAGIDPSGHVTLCQHITKRIPQGDVTAAPKAIVKEVAFNRWTYYPCAEYVTEFSSVKKSDVICGIDGDSVS